ncbi:MAG: nitroreductase family protein [Sporichthyaceae bacterium]
MEFSQVLTRRRMVRGYAARPIASHLLERVVRVVAHAPSAGHCEPHRIVVVTDASVRARLAEIGEPGYPMPWISQAPVQIVLGVREESYHERYRRPDKLQPDGTEIEWPVPFWWFDAGALLTLLHLAAIDAGLVAGFWSPAGPADLRAVAVAVGLPDDVAVAGVVTLGHASDEPEPSGRRPRAPLADHVSWR